MRRALSARHEEHGMRSVARKGNWNAELGEGRRPWDRRGMGRSGHLGVLVLAGMLIAVALTGCTTHIGATPGKHRVVVTPQPVGSVVIYKAHGHRHGCRRSLGRWICRVR